MFFGIVKTTVSTEINVWSGKRWVLMSQRLDTDLHLHV